MLPKISIITPTFNQAQFIEETILSVLNQNYPNLEYIIIDGGSNDNTIEIIKKHEKSITYWVSEKDAGQTNAINKGLKKASGEILAYLNSDDLLFPNSLHEVAQQYLDNKSIRKNILFIGNCFWGNSPNDKSGFLDTPNFPTSISLSCLQRSGLGPQPSIFWTRPNIELPFYDTLIFCMDYEYWLRLLSLDYHVVHINKTLSFFRLHNLSKTRNLKNIEVSEGIAVSMIYASKLKNEQEIYLLKQYNLKRLQLDIENTIWNNRKQVSIGMFFFSVAKSGLKNSQIVKLLLKRVTRK